MRVKETERKINEQDSRRQMTMMIDIAFTFMKILIDRKAGSKRPKGGWWEKKLSIEHDYN